MQRDRGYGASWKYKHLTGLLAASCWLLALWSQMEVLRFAWNGMFLYFCTSVLAVGDDCFLIHAESCFQIYPPLTRAPSPRGYGLSRRNNNRLLQSTVGCMSLGRKHRTITFARKSVSAFSLSFNRSFAALRMTKRGNDGVKQSVLLQRFRRRWRIIARSCMVHCKDAPLCLIQIPYRHPERSRRI